MSPLRRGFSFAAEAFRLPLEAAESQPLIWAGERLNTMPDFAIVVIQCVPTHRLANPDHHARLLNPRGAYQYYAKTEERALEMFFANWPDARSQDFIVTITRLTPNKSRS